MWGIHRYTARPCMESGPAVTSAPHLTSPTLAPLRALEHTCITRHADIEAWLHRQFLQTPASFYSSVDIRNAGWKMAPVDTNLFPAGFNNLAPALTPLIRNALQTAIQRICPQAATVLLIPENHTRNRFYLDNIARLFDLLTSGGFEVRLGSVDPDAPAVQELTSANGQQLTIHATQRVGGRVMVDGFDPCVVLLNNDLSSGLPAVLENLEQPLLPPSALGWNKRLKSDHFGIYAQVAQGFGDMLGIDPWLVDPLWRNCGQVDFMKREGEECLIHNVDALLGATAAKYAEHGIDDSPYVVIKADAGTYGMGIMIARSVDDVRELNRKQRKSMAATKGRSVSQVILQEGVPTAERVNGAIAEPVFYCVEHNVIGGFYRVHTERGRDENLNAPGAHFEPFAIADSCSCPDAERDCDAQPNRLYAAGVIARLAALAAAREIARVNGEAA